MSNSGETTFSRSKINYRYARVSAKKNQKKFKWVNAYTISVGDDSSVWITALEILQTDLTKLQAL